MHQFTELVDRCVTFTLEVLDEANGRTVRALETSGSTALVKALQMIQLQKAIFAVGMFSIFEAILQDSLNCKDGFLEAKKHLDASGEKTLRENFHDLYLAVNVLKHGRGASYNNLVAKVDTVPFRVKLPGDSFFEEGDVSEIFTLIEVDDAFVKLCGSVISQVAGVIRIRTGAAL